MTDAAIRDAAALGGWRRAERPGPRIIHHKTIHLIGYCPANDNWMKFCQPSGEGEAAQGRTDRGGKGAGCCRCSCEGTRAR